MRGKMDCFVASLLAMTEERQNSHCDAWRDDGAYTFTSVATETCGQLRPLKFSSTVWVY